MLAIILKSVEIQKTMKNRRSFMDLQGFGSWIPKVFFEFSEVRSKTPFWVSWDRFGIDFGTIWGSLFDHFGCQKHQKSTMKKVSKNMCEMLEAYKVLRVSWVALGGLLGLFGARMLTDLSGGKRPSKCPTRKLTSSNPQIRSNWPDWAGIRSNWPDWAGRLAGWQN